MRFPLLPVIAAFLALQAPARAETSPYTEQRIETLLSRMTLEEKVGQLIITGVDQKDAAEIIARGGAGATIGFDNPHGVARLQQIARGSRLGIPLITGLDVLHGFRTLLPLPLAEAASFDLDLARRAAELAARETAPSGINWTFAPMADLGRDPRWGRIIEGSGEDAFLTRELTRARVEGFRAGGLAVSLKHFAGYGAVAGGRDYDSASIPQNELLDEHFPPFRAGIEAGAETVMTALTVLNGVPATSDTALVTDMLKKKWGFDGFVVSDWSAIDGLIKQGVAADGAEAARKALLAGVDMDMMSGFYTAHLVDEVRAGRVPMANIDDSVRRVLRVKFRMGLFDTPQPDPDRADATVLTPDIRQAARGIVRETLVLLRNEGDVLPLSPQTRNIAVIGQLAGDPSEMLGPHEARGNAANSVTILDGIRSAASARGANVTFAEGCSRTCDSDVDFAKAADLARQADVVVAVLGEPREFSGEAATRSQLSFWGKQGELLEALIATGKPVVLVIMAGRPMDLSSVVDRVPAILMAWYPGTEGGSAVADILFGDAAPSAKLPLSWPRSVGQAPLRYDYLATGRPYESDARFTLKFIDEKPGPLFPFGHGLTYTRFSYSALSVLTPALTADGTAEIRVRLSNDGPRDGTEVVQLYVRDELASVARPMRQLKAFQRVSLKAGEARDVTLKVPAAELGFSLADGSYVVEPGRFTVWVGSDSTASLQGSFEVTNGLRRAP